MKSPLPLDTSTLTFGVPFPVAKIVISVFAKNAKSK
jgi:hypothetical protein